MTNVTRIQEADKSLSIPSDKGPAGGTSKSEKVETPSPEAKKQELIFGKYKNTDAANKAIQELGGTRLIEDFDSIVEARGYYKGLEHVFRNKPKEVEEDLSSLFDEATPQNPPVPLPPLDPYGVDSQKEMKNNMFKVDMYTQVKRAVDPNFKEYEAEAIAYVKRSPSLLAMLRTGDTSVIDAAYDVIKARRERLTIEEEKQMAAEKARKEVENISATAPKVEAESTATPQTVPPKPADMAGEVIDAIVEGRIDGLVSKTMSELEDKALKRKR